MTTIIDTTYQSIAPSAKPVKKLSVKPKPKKKKKVVKHKNIVVVDLELEELVKKRPAYRPTVYTMKHVILGERYLQECIDEEIKRVKSQGPSVSWEYVTRPKLPTIEGLCSYYYQHGIGINRDTIYAWKGEESKKEFSDMLQKVLTEQANRLLQKGLSGEYNPTIAKLILSRHGYIEKTEVEQTTVGVLGVLGLSQEKRGALEELVKAKFTK